MSIYIPYSDHPQVLSNIQGGMQVAELVQSQRFNATTSIINFGVQPSQDILEQTIFTQSTSLGDNENYLGGYVFSTLDNTNRNGIIVRYRHDNNTMAFLADSGTISTPSKTTDETYVPGALQTFAATYDGSSISSSGISLYFSENGKILRFCSGAGGSSGTGSVQIFGGNVDIGNRTSDTGRTLNGYVFRIARWSRILTYKELVNVQLYGPEIYPEKLIFNWANNRDWSINNLTPTSYTAITPGGYSPFTTPFTRTNIIQPYLYTPLTAEQVATALRKRSYFFMYG